MNLNGVTSLTRNVTPSHRNLVNKRKAGSDILKGFIGNQMLCLDSVSPAMNSVSHLRFEHCALTMMLGYGFHPSEAQQGSQICEPKVSAYRSMLHS